MKTEIIKFFTFICMFVVLGLQTLLHGSWSDSITEKGKSEQEGNL